MTIPQLENQTRSQSIANYRNLVAKSKPKPGVQTVSLPFEIGRRLF